MSNITSPTLAHFLKLHNDSPAKPFLVVWMDKPPYHVCNVMRRWCFEKHIELESNSDWDCGLGTDNNKRTPNNAVWFAFEDNMIGMEFKLILDSFTF